MGVPANVYNWHSSSNRCNAPIRSLSEAQRTCREVVGRVDPTLLARSAASNRAEQCPLCPDNSDFDLLSDGERIIDLDSEISARRLPVRLDVPCQQRRFRPDQLPLVPGRELRWG